MFKRLLKKLMEQRGSIEETDGDLLAAQAYEEIAAEKEGREPKDLMSNPDDQEDKEDKEADDKDQDDDESEDQDSKSEDEETEDDDDNPEKESDYDSETQDSDDNGNADDLDKQIEEHAEKYQMSYAEAKDDLEKTQKIIEQYKNDPKEMAKSLRNKDREYDKLKAQIEKDAKKEPAFEPLTEDQFYMAAEKHIKENKDKFIAAYAKKRPAKADMLSEEAIIEEILEIEWAQYSADSKKRVAEIKERAIQVRDEVISSIKDNDKKFLPEVKALLSELSDRDIVDPDADFTYFIDVAKGRKYDEDIKKAEERGYQRAKEGAKILGVKEKSSGSKPTKTTNSSVSLNQEQKDAALHMFATEDHITEDKAYEMYKETFAKELKKDPSFV